MLFPTVTFAIFFMVVLPVSWLLMPKPARWRIFILAASYFFYGYWNPRFILLLAFSTLFNQAAGKLIYRTESAGLRRLILAGAVVGNLGVLGYFKYYDFFVSSAQNMLENVGIHVAPEIVAITLPVGISFFTFQALSYVIDIYRRTFEPVSLLEFAVYESFFPHIVAGPIVRAAEFLPQLKERHDPRRVDASRAFFLIFLGLFKKVVIANFLATNIVDQVFASPGRYSGPTTLFAIYGYAVQIYADFSGYTDMAIGFALLLGFRFPQNFDSPYAATSIQDFWRRWHMTLSRWLRDYVYIPLGGNRGGRLLTYRNLMLTMLVGGLWHGAGWTFVVWGGLWGAGLVAERWWRDRPGYVGRSLVGFRRGWHRFLTFQFACFAWIFFRADSFADARDIIVRLFTAWGQASPLVTGGVLLAIAVGIGSQYLPPRFPLLVMARFSRLPIPAQAVVLAFGLLLANAMGPEGVAPFIYFRF